MSQIRSHQACILRWTNQTVSTMIVKHRPMAWELCWHGFKIEGPIQIILLEGIRLSHTPVNSPCSPSIYEGSIFICSSVLSTYLKLPWHISVYLDLSQFTLTYLKLPWLISVMPACTFHFIGCSSSGMNFILMVVWNHEACVHTVQCMKAAILELVSSYCSATSHQ